MSKMNNALSELADKQPSFSEPLERAKVVEVKKRSALPWFIAGVTVSLALGGWALTSSPQPQVEPELLLTDAPKENSLKDPVPLAFSEQPKPELEVSPTSKTTLGQATLFSPEPVSEENAIKIQEDKSTSVPNKHAPVVIAKRETVKAQLINEPTPLKTAVVKSKALTSSTPDMQIEQVELTPSELALQAQSRAEKALEGNNLDLAIEEYHKALRYMPSDDRYRQKLAALYYGRNDVRMAAELLQKGIQSSPDREPLRLALAKLLLKENQQEAALTPLVYLPQSPSLDYLSLRAALAQKVSQNDLAIESYQRLVALEPDNGRWWMGLAITQERVLSFDDAYRSYQSAQNKIGLSTRSQQFIKDRLQLLESLRGASDAN